MKSQPPEEDAGGTEALAIAATGRRAGAGERSTRRSAAWLQRARKRVFEAEAETARQGLGPRGPPNFGTSGLEGGVR